ncbi:prolyl oligopeptidase family serine peptidase [Streptomyces sp. NPDC052236]|uniref:prolyl oligopeptidase family serine peptidase n=1 Tax=Streptomyces sp. NPDC052236 TaxID=3365686 RepID=UPI0037D0B866
MSNAVQAPGFATLHPGRAVETQLVDGRLQAVAWDIAADRRRVLTTRPGGVDMSEIEPDGGHIWWFDSDGTGEGIWRRQPFAGGPAFPALRGVPRGRAYGIAFDRTGSLAAVGVGVDGTSRCYVGAPAGPARLVGAVPGYLSLVDMTPDGRLLALAGEPGGADAVVVWPSDGAAAVRLPGRPEARLWPMEFRPDLDGEADLLLVVELANEYIVATWRPSEGSHPRLVPGLSFASEISARWHGADRGVLVQHEHAGRSRLVVADLDRSRVTDVPMPGGSLHDLSLAPDGTLHCVWSQESMPPRTLVLRPGAPGTGAGSELDPLDGAHRTERWTPRSYGRIHSFVTTPPGTGPWPTLFLVHGGPAAHDRDSYDPRIDLLIRAGYAVVRTNYRGSTGYGTRWQHDWGHRVGLAQIEDLAAVRAALVAEGVAVADRTGLCGFSWGGYLALLALGAQPELWSLGMAAYPIADYVAAHHATTPALRAVDRELFGGGPAEAPERYRAACPMTYVARVRAPVLLIASPTDDRCPPAQVDRYAKELRSLAVPHDVVWVDGGHRSRRSADHALVLATMLRFTESAWQVPTPDHPAASRSWMTDESREGGEER